MYPDELATTEAVLRAYPDALWDKAMREKFLLDKYSGGALMDEPRVEGGSRISVGDVYAMAAEKDARLQRARHIVKAIEKGMNELKHNERRVLHVIYFEGLNSTQAAAQLGLSTSYIRALAESVRTKMASYCISVYSLVCELREILREERLDILRTLENKKREG